MNEHLTVLNNDKIKQQNIQSKQSDILTILTLEDLNNICGSVKQFPECNMS